MEVSYFPLNKKIPNDLALCLGNFDGVHLGHQKLFKEAKDSGKQVGVLLFDKNPAEFFPSSKSKKVLTGLNDKIRILESLGIDYVFVIKVSKEFFALKKDEFIKDYIDALHPSLIVCGSDYSFASKAEGKPEDLKEKYHVHLVNLLEIDNKKISTQDIIRLIEEGKIEEANSLLGRPYEVRGKVIEGEKIGRTIGYPTANLKLEENYVLPLSGVYSGTTNGLLSFINVGTNPTVGILKEEIIETHILDFSSDIYGETIILSFRHFIREEKTFASLSELKSQLDKDITKVKF